MGEFEWENKINIVTQSTDVSDFLENLMHSTNMSIVGRPLTKTEERSSSLASVQRRERISKAEAREQIQQTKGIRALSTAPVSLRSTSTPARFSARTRSR